MNWLERILFAFWAWGLWAVLVWLLELGEAVFGVEVGHALR